MMIRSQLVISDYGHPEVCWVLLRDIWCTRVIRKQILNMSLPRLTLGLVAVAVSNHADME